jgi:hypothetical protein
MLPDIGSLTDYISSQVAGIILIVVFINLARAFISQRWGSFATNIIVGIVCWIIVANPAEFESIAKGAWNLIKSGGLS